MPLKFLIRLAAYLSVCFFIPSGDASPDAAYREQICAAAGTNSADVGTNSTEAVLSPYSPDAARAAVIVKPLRLPARALHTQTMKPVCTDSSGKPPYENFIQIFSSERQAGIPGRECRSFLCIYRC